MIDRITKYMYNRVNYFLLLRRGVLTFGYITEDSLNLSKYVPEPLSLCHLIVPTIVAQAFLFCLWCEWIGVIFFVRHFTTTVSR